VCVFAPLPVVFFVLCSGGVSFARGKLLPHCRQLSKSLLAFRRYVGGQDGSVKSEEGCV